MQGLPGYRVSSSPACNLTRFCLKTESKGGAGDVTQGQNTCLLCVQPPVSLKKENSNNKNQYFSVSQDIFQLVTIIQVVLEE